MNDGKRPLKRREWREAQQGAQETPAEGQQEEATPLSPLAGPDTPGAFSPAPDPSSAPDDDPTPFAPASSPSSGAGGDFSLATMFAPTATEQTEKLPTILTVCTGNICRSPLAATLLATRLSDLGLLVESAGTQALVGHGMPEPARRVALAQGADPVLVADHEARLLTEPRLRDADLVLAMTAEHRTFALHLEPSGLRRTFTVREFARLAATFGDEELQETAASAGSAPRGRLDALVTAIADRRGTSPAPEGDEDVIDPYRRPFEVYEESAAQLVPALDQVERVVRAALG